MSQVAPNHRPESYPQPSPQKTLRKLLLVPSLTNNNNKNAPRFEPAIIFESDLITKGLLNESDLTYLENMLAHHPLGQVVGDELAGQLRARGRGLGGVRSPRGLAKTLLRAAILVGVEDWVYEGEEAALRSSRCAASVREAERLACRKEEEEREVARRAAGPTSTSIEAKARVRAMLEEMKKGVKK
jgi:hypothetical protein